MFDALKKKLNALLGIPLSTDTNQFELDSVDSISSSICGINSYQDTLPEYKIKQIVRWIKHLDRESPKRMNMLEFFDLLQSSFYTNTSMILLSSFMKDYRMIPKNIRIHQFVYFLYYGMYYHTIRSTIDIIDINMTLMHDTYLCNLKMQLEYVNHIIRETRNHG